MEKITLLLALLISNTVFSGTFKISPDSISDVNKNTELNLLKRTNYEIEVDLLGISGIIGRKITKRSSANLGLGYFPYGNTIYLLSKPDEYPKVIGDFFILNLFWSYYYNKNIRLELGSKSSIAMAGKSDLCEECIIPYTSGYLSILIGSRNFKLGSSILISTFRIGSSKSNFVLMLNPIFLRITF